MLLHPSLVLRLPSLPVIHVLLATFPVFLVLLASFPPCLRSPGPVVGVRGHEAAMLPLTPLPQTPVNLATVNSSQDFCCEFTFTLFLPLPGAKGLHTLRNVAIPSHVVLLFFFLLYLFYLLPPPPPPPLRRALPLLLLTGAVIMSELPGHKVS